MERRFRVRWDDLRTDAEVAPSLFRGARPRLESFLQPFVASRNAPEQRTHAKQYVAGRVSDLDRQDAESIAYLHDRERQGLQKFLGQTEWGHGPLLAELAKQVGTERGQPDGVLVFDPSAFPKKGTASVGVPRPWCGRLGKRDHCQVGIYLGYVSRREHARVDFRLDRPKEWAGDRRRRKTAGGPAAVRFRTRHERILPMLEDRGSVLSHAWISGDDEWGRCSWFRERQSDGSWKHDYLLSNAELATPLAEFARVFQAPHRIEECRRRAKSEAGLGDYQVRTWEGWHHHQTLSLIATWFLPRETRRGRFSRSGR